jgi:hypothetical protein
MQTDGRTDRQTDRQKDMKKLVVAFRNSASSPKNELFCRLSHARGCNLCRSIPASFDVVRIQSRTRDMSNGLFRCKPETDQRLSYPSKVIDQTTMWSQFLYFVDRASRRNSV